MLLGRVRNVTLGVCLVAAARRMWSLSEPLVRNIANDLQFAEKWIAAANEINAGRLDTQPRTPGRLALLTPEELNTSATFLEACTAQSPHFVTEACAAVTQRWIRAGTFAAVTQRWIRAGSFPDSNS